MIISNKDPSNIITENPCLPIKAYQLFRKDKHFPALADFFFKVAFYVRDILQFWVNLVEKKEMATHSSVFAWRIPWTEKPGRLQSMGSHRVGHD